jgi:two-component system C4-dicarboxylate transport sensor histidine kinase DctB
MRANVQKSFKGIPWWGWVSAAALYVGVAGAAVDFAWERAIDALEETGAHRLDLYASSLKSELGRFEILPALVARQDGVRALLKAAPHDAPTLVHAVNTYLEAVNRDAGSGAVDVIDLRGEVIAASNWNETISFVGTNVSYRPYFKDALARGSGRFFGIGTNTGVPGVYFASAVRDDGVPIGVAAVKISVDPLESAWRAPGVAAMVVDGNGVVVISTEPAWKSPRCARSPRSSSATSRRRASTRAAPSTRCRTAVSATAARPRGSAPFPIRAAPAAPRVIS